MFLVFLDSDGKECICKIKAIYHVSEAVLIFSSKYPASGTAAALGASIWLSFQESPQNHFCGIIFQVPCPVIKSI